MELRLGHFVNCTVTLQCIVNRCDVLHLYRTDSVWFSGSYVGLNAGVSLPPFPERNFTLPKSGISGCVKGRVRGQRENIGMPVTCQRENVTTRPYLFHANCSATVHTYVTRLSSQFWGRLGPGFRSRSASVCNNAGRGVGSGDCVMQDAIYRDNLE